MSTNNWKILISACTIFIVFLGISSCSTTPNNANKKPTATVLVQATTATPLSVSTEEKPTEVSRTLPPEQKATPYNVEPVISPTTSVLTSASITETRTSQLDSNHEPNPGLGSFAKIELGNTQWNDWALLLNQYRGVYSDDYVYSAMAFIEKTILTEMATGTVKWEVDKPSAPINSTNALVFSHNSEFLANGGGEEVVYIYKVDDGSLVNEIQFNEEIGNLSFSFDDNLLAISTICGQVQPCKLIIADLLSEQEIIYPGQLYFSNIIFSPNNHVLAIGRTNDIQNLSETPIILWDIEEESIQELPPPELHQVENEIFRKLIDFSSDGNKLSFIVNTSLQLWNLQEQKYEQLDNNIIDSYPLQLLFSNEGQYLSVLTSNDEVNVWKTTGDYLGAIEGTKTISKILFTPDDKYLLLFNRDGSIESWELISK